MWNWLQKIYDLGKNIVNRLADKKENEYLRSNFAHKIQERHEQKSKELYAGYVPLVHRRAIRQTTMISSQVNLQQIEQLIKRYQIVQPPAAPSVIYRQDRVRLLSVIRDIGRQDGERKELEQLIFRRKEQELKKVIRTQEEQVLSLKEELLQQKKVIESLEQKIEEPVIDTGKLYTEFRKRLERQLYLERQRAGL